MDFPEELYHRCMRHIRLTGNRQPEEELGDDQDEEHELEPEARPTVTTDVDGQPLDIKMPPKPKVIDRESDLRCERRNRSSNPSISHCKVVC
jgi:hypothetical protein